MDGQGVPAVSLSRAPRLEVVPRAVDGEAQAALEGRAAIGRGEQVVVLHRGDLRAGSRSGRRGPGRRPAAVRTRRRWGGRCRAGASERRQAASVPAPPAAGAQRLGLRSCGMFRTCAILRESDLGRRHDRTRAGDGRRARAALAGGRHLLLEGPVGSGKTTLALAVCRDLGRADGARRRRRPLHGEAASPAGSTRRWSSRSATARRRSSPGRWCGPCARGASSS